GSTRARWLTSPYPGSESPTRSRGWWSSSSPVPPTPPEASSSWTAASPPARYRPRKRMGDRRRPRCGRRAVAWTRGVTRSSDGHPQHPSGPLARGQSADYPLLMAKSRLPIVTRPDVWWLPPSRPVTVQRRLDGRRPTWHFQTHPTTHSAFGSVTTTTFW